MIRIRLDDGTFRQVAEIRIRLDDGTFRIVRKIDIRDPDGTARAVYGAADTATVAPENVYGQIARRTAGPVLTDSAAASAQGGPYVCAWSRTDANPTTWTILSPNSTETSFRAAAVAPGETQTATFVASLTANGRTIAAPPVTATAENLGYDNGGVPL